MRRVQVPVENVAEIVWGGLLVVYLIGSGRPEFRQPQVLAIFGISAAAAFLELYLRHRRCPWILTYDSITWTLLLSAMVAVTGGRGSELWPAYILMSLTAPSVGRPSVPYGLLAINSLIYLGICLWINPFGAPLTLPLLVLRIGLFFLVAYVVDRSMRRERAALQAVQDRVTELVSARDAERQRMAGDLHDWLGAGLIAPMRKLELAQRAATPAAAQIRIAEALDGLRYAHEEVRRLMENLHPHLLEQMGVTDALRAYLEQWGEEHGVVTAYQGDLAPAPPPDVALAAFRILQEALTNVAKHAGAAHVTVRLALRTEWVMLTVTDDGCGFSEDAPPGPARRTGSTGRGLAGMAERAAVFGGSLRVTSRPGKGTAIEAKLPVVSTGG